MAREAGTFNRGGNAGTQKCRECGDLRQKANIDLSTGLCIRPGSRGYACYDKAGDVNSVYDGYITEAEFAERYGEEWMG